MGFFRFVTRSLKLWYKEPKFWAKTKYDTDHFLNLPCVDASGALAVIKQQHNLMWPPHLIKQTIFSCFASSLQELCCTASLWPGVRINSRGSSFMRHWCSSPWCCRSWGSVLCLTSTTPKRHPTSTPYTAGSESQQQLFSQCRYPTWHELFYVFGKCHTFVQQFVSCCACVFVIYLSVWMQWVAGMAGFLLPCSPISLRKRLKPMHVWLGGSILTLSIAACISGINEKLFFVLWVQIFCISFD